MAVTKLASNLHVKVITDKTKSGKVKFRTVALVYVGDMLVATNVFNGRAATAYVESEFRKSPEKFKRAP
mgnify:CR=1 FL=1